MKMKKLLAGVLSAAMVATMIPASMAFSVSAAPEDSLVASYDLTTDTGRKGWVAGGAAAANIVTDGNGVTFSNGYIEANQNYSIANPLNGKAAEGFSVALTVTVPAGTYVNAFEAMFNFNGVDNKDTDGVFSVSGNGGGVHYNDWDGHYWDINTGAAVDLTAGSIFVLTVDADNNMNLYSNGVLVNSFGQSNIAPTGTVESVVNYVNDMMYFSLGAAPALFGQPAMEVSAVSFYKTALTEDEVKSLGTYKRPELKDGGIEEGLISAYDFNGSLNNNVEGTGAATAIVKGNEGSMGEAFVGEIQYDDSNTAVEISPTNGYGLKLDVPAAQISNNTYTVSFDVSYQALSVSSAGFFIYTDNTHYHSIGQGWKTEWADMPMIWSLNGTVWNDFVTNAGMEQDQSVVITVVFDNIYAYLYMDGALVQTGYTPSIVNETSTFYLGVNAWDEIASITVDSAYVYNRALSANDVEMLYAKSIADTLDVHMLGRQLGTTSGGENGVRFVAGIDESVTENTAVEAIGWL